jgi:hypothetical protein
MRVALFTGGPRERALFHKIVGVEMARMPIVPQNWLADDEDARPHILPFHGDDQPEMTPLPMARDADSFILSGLANREVQPAHGTSLALLMEPREIASVPGLADYGYSGNGGLGDYADQRVQRDVGGQQGAGGYAPTFDRMSLESHNLNPSGLNFSDVSPEPGEKAERAAKSASILGHLTDFWNVQNHAVGAFLGQEGAEMLGKIAEPVAAAAIPVENAFKAQADTSKGAQQTLTWMGAGAKAATALGGMGLGAMAGALGGPAAPITIPLGAAIGAFAPDVLYRHTSNEELGRAIDRAFLDRR